jgi:hypothetical protein
MNGGVAVETIPSRRIGRSVLALLAGFVVNVVLSVGTDLAMYALRILPAAGHGPMTSAQSALAAAYRTLYAVLGSYVVARLAPSRPMEHALIGGAIGMLLATAGAAATWNKGLAPHWYAVLLIVLALPTAWAGARLWMVRGR